MGWRYPKMLPRPRTVVLALLSIASLAAQGSETSQAKTGDINGIVVERKSGDPVRKALVIVSREMPAGTGTMTADDGTFFFHKLDPGTYSISITRTGYVADRESEHKTVLVKAGETLSDVKLNLLRTGVITGRVIDADGEAVAGASVQLDPLLQKKRSGRLGRLWFQTDDRGEYRAYDVAPGDYRVWVTYQSHEAGEIRMQTPPKRDGQPAPAETYVPSYFPGTADIHQAGAVHVDSGGEVHGIDVPLIRAHAVKVRGRIATSSDGPPVLAAFVSMARLDEAMKPVQGAQLSAAVQGAKGDFEISDVLPGTYSISAVVLAGGLDDEHKRTAQRMIEVRDSDVENVELLAGTPLNIPGKVVVPEGRKIPPGLMVIAVPRERSQGFLKGGSGVSQVGAGGTFTLKHLDPGEYDIVLASSGAGDDLYLGAIRAGDADALADGLHVAEPASDSVEILLKPNGATLDCAVKSDKDGPVPAAHVVMIPDGSKRRQLALHGECNTNENGECKIRGIAPGEYRLYAFPQGTVVDRTDPDSLKPYEKEAVAVKLAEGDRQKVELNPAPVE